ncbi:metallophosphoesterase [Patescibacteria group bacterium]
MKIGVISDSHDNIKNLETAFKLLSKENVELVFHCGDLSAPFTIDYFKNLQLPVKAVFGNNEGDKVNILARIKRNKIDFAYAPNYGLMWNLKLENKKIAVFHGHQKEITQSIIKSNQFDFVLTGHTHEPYIKTINKTVWINPGCICGWSGLDIKAEKPSLAIVDLKISSAKIEFI